MSNNIPAEQAEAQTGRKRSRLGGLLPFIGVILFVGATILQFAGGADFEWRTTLVQNAVFYMVGWSGIGAGIAHIFFGQKISRTIGFAHNPYEFEVGAANLALGIVGLIAINHSQEFWLAAILTSSIFRVVCGIGHIREMMINRNFAINNTAILFVNFVVPAFLIFAYYAWA
ncbi:MAG: hypothetical protein LCH31_02620 [Actinobacteria bacterium]|nr:hypothetical protein [Actinomycetota bacterium]